MRPMLLQHIDKLLDVKEGREWNAYTVYEALVEQWLDREVRKLLDQHKGRRVPERKELFHACLRVAERMQRQGTWIISKEELEQLIREDENIAWLEKFELGGRSLLNRNSDRAFRFSHYTIQEFLVAYGLFHDMLMSDEIIRGSMQLVEFLNSDYLEELGTVLNKHDIVLLTVQNKKGCITVSGSYGHGERVLCGHKSE